MGLSTDGTIGLQTIVLPGVHQTGEQIRFEPGFDATPANVDAGGLVLAVRKVAAAALQGRHWPAEGSRRQAFLALAGVLARAQWTFADAKAFHCAFDSCLSSDG